MGKGIESAEIQLRPEDLLAMAAFASIGPEELTAAVLSGELDLADAGIDGVQLTVRFANGGSVTYRNVPADVAQQMVQDPSQYNSILRGQYS